MNTIAMDMPVSINYWNFIKKLSDQAKRELILMLQVSLDKKSDDEILDLITDDSGEKYSLSADEYVAEMTSGRTEREIIEL